MPAATMESKSLAERKTSGRVLKKEIVLPKLLSQESLSEMPSNNGAFVESYAPRPPSIQASPEREETLIFDAQKKLKESVRTEVYQQDAPVMDRRNDEIAGNKVRKREAKRALPSTCL